MKLDPDISDDAISVLVELNRQSPRRS